MTPKRVAEIAGILNYLRDTLADEVYSLDLHSGQVNVHLGHARDLVDLAESGSAHKLTDMRPYMEIDSSTRYYPYGLYVTVAGVVFFGRITEEQAQRLKTAQTPTAATVEV